MITHLVERKLVTAQTGGARQRVDAQRNRARILAAAETVFSSRGTAASTEEVARSAGVAVGTVFRHFPTKADLLQAIMKGLLDRLTDTAHRLAEDSDPAEGFFAFFEQVVQEAAAKTAVVELLAQAGTQVEVTPTIQGLRQAVGILLQRARQVDAVRSDVGPVEVMALLAATSEGALHGGWDRDLRDRVLGVVLDGLRPVGLARRSTLVPGPRRAAEI